jgi:ribosomal protein S18 acetylase RimI-like enzyme
MTELERCLEFVARMADRAAAQKVRSEHGVALLAPDFPDVWSRNYLFVERSDDVSAAELAAEVDAIFEPLDLRHRKVELFDADAGDRLEPGFRELGWKGECDVIMTWKRPPDRAADTALVDEASVEDLVPAWAESWQRDANVPDEDVARQLVENKRTLATAVETRFFAARVEGTVASYCELYSDGQVAQIENVLTLERFRNRGLARATVSRALTEARDADHELIFLIADRDDWPKELYRKLGFDEVGRIWEFLRSPTR